MIKVPGVKEEYTRNMSPVIDPTDPDEKHVIAIVFSKEHYPLATQVDGALWSLGLDADRYNAEESENAFRVVTCGKHLGAYNQNTIERAPDLYMQGVSYVIGKVIPAMQFQIENPDSNEKLDDWFQVMYVGKFKKGGVEFEITTETFAKMISNFKKDVLKKTALPIDYSHNNDEKAAGWIKDLRLSDDGQSLYAKAEWTPNGRNALLQKEFRFFSVEFSLAHYDAESDQDFGPTLHGGALTNIPFLKLPPILPLALNQTELETIIFQEEKQMSDNIQLSRLEADLKAKGEELRKLTEENQKLSEFVKKTETFADRIVKLEKENGDLKAKAEAEEKNKKFDSLVTEGKAVEAQREAYIAGDMVKFAENAMKINPVKPSKRAEEVSIQLSDEDKQMFETFFKHRGLTLEDYAKLMASNNTKTLI